jgi:hypothetical protein
MVQWLALVRVVNHRTSMRSQCARYIERIRDFVELLVVVEVTYAISRPHASDEVVAYGEGCGSSARVDSKFVEDMRNVAPDGVVTDE